MSFRHRLSFQDRLTGYSFVYLSETCKLAFYVSMVDCVITANGNAQRHSRFCGLCRPVQPDVPRHTVK